MTRLRRFENGQRVRVVETGHPLEGEHGVVERLRMSDSAAWVTMDNPLPDALRSFPVDDPHGRGRTIILYPEECAFGGPRE